MPAQYAQATQVPVDRSRAEIERILTRYGAHQFMYGWDEDRAVLGFAVGGRRVRFILPIPPLNDYRFTPSRKYRRSDRDTLQAHEQAIRQRWRALALVIKAKPEAVSAGIVTFDEEFLAHFVLPSGESVADRVIPALDIASVQGILPPLLPGQAELTRLDDESS